MGKDDIFTANVDSYEEWFIRNNHLLDCEVAAIESMLPDSGDGIEIGVGTGIFASRLGVRHGAEPSKKMREKAVARGIDVIDAYAENLPIGDGTYQFALMVTVDCFLDDIGKAFGEVRRILVDGGIFIIAFIDRETPLGHVYDKNKKSDRFYENAEFHSTGEIVKFLEAAGFVMLDVKQTVFSLENKPQEIRAGAGEGVFAVIKAKKEGMEMIEQVYKMAQGNEKTIEKVILDENINYLHMIFNKEEGAPEHYTNATLYMTVVRGKLSIRLGDQEAHEYSAGTIIKIPDKTKMTAKNIYDETLELIIVKAPAPKM